MEKIYGYCRVSTKQQNIERQERNILNKYPEAYIVKEHYTGTKFDGRKEWNKLYNMVQKEKDKGNDITIIFDSVSRMSRDSESGFRLYEELFNLDISLVFLNEPHINTDTYRKAMSINIEMTDTNVDILLKAVKEYLLELAREQIRIAFDQAEKEVIDNHLRTSQGIETYKLNGGVMGRTKGRKYPSKKEIKAKEIIIKKSKDFNGNNTDKEVIKICNITKNTFYKYKRELKCEK